MFCTPDFEYFKCNINIWVYLKSDFFWFSVSMPVDCREVAVASDEAASSSLDCGSQALRFFFNGRLYKKKVKLKTRNKIIEINLYLELADSSGTSD